MWSLRFVPFMRPGLLGLASRDAKSGRASAQVSVDLVDAAGVQLLAGGQSVPIPLQGPADAIGIDPAMIARTVPSAGERAFPSNKLVFVELLATDLPWRLSPDAPQGNRLLPWITLLVLPEGAFSVLPPASRALPPRLRVLAGQRGTLPDPARSWAWAHAQLVADTGAKGAQVLSAPELSCSRVMSPRRLRAGTRYQAFLVPTFEAGRLAGLSPHPGDVRPEDLVPWKAQGTGLLDLPIYLRWAFEAGPPDGTEAALRALGADVDGKTRTIGRRAIDGGDPGLPLSPSPSPDAFEVGGALLPFGDPGLFADARAADVGRELRKALLEKGLRPPIFGSLSVRALAKLGDDASLKAHFDQVLRDDWLADLNLRRRNRVAAALGTEVVKRCQEAFVAECWRQVADLRRANEHLRAAQIGATIGTLAHEKHFAPLPEGRALAMAQPFHDLATLKDGRTLAEAVEGTALSGGGLSFASRKVFQGRARRAASGDGDGFARFVEARARPGGADLSRSQRSTLFGDCPLRPDVVLVDRLPEGAVSLFHPTPAVRARLQRTLFVDGAARQALSEVEASPRVRAPLYEPLLALGIEAFLPRAAGLEKNKVALFRENREAITAFLAGANHEMARELAWRGFPLAPGSTPLRSFWEPLVLAEDGIDVTDLPCWRALGEPAPGLPEEIKPAPGAFAGRVVIGMRGDLVQQCPDLLIHLLRTADPPRPNDLPELVARLDEGTSGEGILDPVFRARAGADLVFHGFALTEAAVKAPGRRYWLVLSQPPSLPVFGAKERPPGAGPVGAVDPVDLTWDHLRLDGAGCIDPVALAKGASLRDARWDEKNTSATIASVLFRHPIQRVIDVRALLPKEG